MSSGLRPEYRMSINLYLNLLKWNLCLQNVLVCALTMTVVMSREVHVIVEPAWESAGRC